MKRANYPEDISYDFKNEIHFCSHYKHRCFTPFYGFSKERGKIIGFLYEFMRNDSLASLSESQMINVFMLATISRIFQGINYLHSNSLIHRDIKPSNILLNHDFVPFISDFETIRHHIDDDETITQDIRSAFYSTPEQFKGLNISYPTDIYLFGLLIYFIFENDHLFSQLNSPFSLNKESYKVLPLTKGSIDMRNIYLSCVKYDPDERPNNSANKNNINQRISEFFLF
ncbi:Interleukin-1 receptor-associated kinase 4 [Tritrichomonas musculus]|uniref:Interleukin-1 receptor-associated kinase 4 n=1 Tax=Tritrichomonas musculus TaxID=1915356 RepID=A0ABR2K8G3_9EUKA